MSGTIPFLIYPAANRVPGTYAEIDPSGANTGVLQQRTLLIGQVGGTLAPSVVLGVPALSAGGGNAASLYGGAGYMLPRMASRYRALDSFGELWTLPLADDPASVAASGTITISGTATVAGTLALYIGGQVVNTLVNAGDTASVIAGDVVTTIAGRPGLPVTATASGAEITLTARNKGLAGNNIDIRTNYYGAAGGEALPAGLANPVIAPMAGGVTNPTSALTAALANIPSDRPYDFIACPYTDTVSLDALQAFLDDTVGRWSWQQEAFGGFFACFQGTLSGCATFGNARNDQHGSILGIDGTPTPPEECAADAVAVCATSLRADPAVPLQYLATNILAPAEPLLWDIGERNTLLYDGISTFEVGPDGTVNLERMVTTYQVNPAGAPDDSYLDVETMYTLAFCIRDMRTYLMSLYQRKKLVANGTRIPVGSSMTTPQLVLGSAIARYRYQAWLGEVQNPEVFAKQASAENVGGGRVSLRLPYMLANQLRVISMLICFTKP